MLVHPGRSLEKSVAHLTGLRFSTATGQSRAWRNRSLRNLTLEHHDQRHCHHHNHQQHLRQHQPSINSISVSCSLDRSSIDVSRTALPVTTVPPHLALLCRSNAELEGMHNFCVIWVKPDGLAFIAVIAAAAAVPIRSIDGIRS